MRPTIRLPRGFDLSNPRTKKAITDLAAAALHHMAQESTIETTIVRALEQDGWRSFKMESNWSELKKKQTGERGMTDRLFMRPRNQGDPRGPVLYTATRCYDPICDVLWWEFKATKKIRKRAEYLSTEQITWQRIARAQGFLVWSAGEEQLYPPTIEGCARKYLDSGLARHREFFLSLIDEATRVPGEQRR